MSITQKDLGPNSVELNYSASETPATLMAAIDTYVTAHGWELWDAAAPQGYTVGRVYRALQEGSTTAYKYVGIMITATMINLKIYESWNVVSHSGTNDGSWYGTGGTNPTIFPGFAVQLGVADATLILFVNKKWLAMRTRTNLLALGGMFGAFEISKDFGEAESIPSNIFMTNYTGSNLPSPNAGYQMFGCTRAVNAGNGVGQNATRVCNILTPYGGGSNFNSNYGTNLNSIFPINPGVNSALTMTAAEMNIFNQPAFFKLRGRIMGIKLLVGNVVWNDMDTVQLPVDADYYQDASGQAITHHYMPGGLSFLIPA